MTHKAKQESSSSVYNLLIITIGACILWLTPPPVGVEQIGWQSFIIFLVTLALIISKSYDMGVVSFIALSLSLVTGTLTIDVCLEKFSYPVSWLVLMAFFIARGFVVSGLGSRIALYMAACLGSTPLRLSYALIFAEVFIAPFIPSNTARGGGLIYPIAHSLGDNIFGKPVGIHKNQRHLTAFLLYGCFQANLISSSMFLTAMAGNPMIASIGATFGLDGDWVSWCKAAFLPGIICLLITPPLVMYLSDTNITHVEDVKSKSHAAYVSLGSISRKELIMALTFLFLLGAWVIGPYFSIHPTSAAIIAVTGLLVTEVLTWQDVTSDSHAWTTFIWLTVLFTLSSAMKDYGFISWFAHSIGYYMPQANPLLLLVILMAINFYAHYFFASLTSHITTLFQPLMMVGLHAGIQMQPLLFALAFSTSLSAGLTHYGTGTGTVIYGSGYWTLRQWWKIGFFHSTIMLIIFMIFGLPFWL